MKHSIKLLLATVLLCLLSTTLQIQTDATSAVVLEKPSEITNDLTSSFLQMTSIIDSDLEAALDNIDRDQSPDLQGDEFKRLNNEVVEQKREYRRELRAERYAANPESRNIFSD
jgi:hypothetical protein